MAETLTGSSIIQAEKTIITGGDFSQTIHNVHPQRCRNLDVEARKLQIFVSHDAFHDSYEHTHARDHVLTPTDAEIVDTATKWALKKHLERADRVLHLDLSPCSEKQHIAQHITERLDQHHCLRGTFFFRFPEHAQPARYGTSDVVSYALGPIHSNTEYEVSNKTPSFGAHRANWCTTNSPHLRHFMVPEFLDTTCDHVCSRLIVEVDKSVETFDALLDPGQIEKHLELYKQQKGLMAIIAGLGAAFVSAQQMGIKDNRTLWDKMNQGFSGNKILTDKPALRSGLEKQYKIQQDWLGTDHLSQVEIIDFLGFDYAHNAPPTPGKRCITVIYTVMRPLSHGTVHTASADALVPPAIDPKFFSNETDLTLLVEALKFSVKVVETAPLSDVVRAHVHPGPEVLAPGEDLDNRLRECVKQNSGSVYHPIGTAAMLPRANSGIVDSILKVYGTENLRVVNLSSFPMSVATHPQTLAYAITEKVLSIQDFCAVFSSDTPTIGR